LDVDTIFGDLRHECLHQRVVRNTIFRKALPVLEFDLCRWQGVLDKSFVIKFDSYLALVDGI
jgi:ribosomal protein L10